MVISMNVIPDLGKKFSKSAASLERKSGVTRFLKPLGFSVIFILFIQSKYEKTFPIEYSESLANKQITARPFQLSVLLLLMIS